MTRLPASLLSATVALAVALTGCSSSGDRSGSGPASDATPAAQAAHAPEPTKTPSFTGARSERFCEVARSAADRLATRPVSDGTADDARRLVRSAQEMMTSLASAAPDEIKSDARVMAKAYADLAKTLESDPPKLATGSGHQLDHPDVSQASDRLNAYYRNVCGLNVG